MKLDKSTKRIAKRVKKGFQGYPEITLAYFGETSSHATEVMVKFVLEEGAEAQKKGFLVNVILEKTKSFKLRC